MKALSAMLMIVFTMGTELKAVESSIPSWEENEKERAVMGYSDSWVVELEGGRDEADKLADEHGFINLGQVMLLHVQ